MLPTPLELIRRIEKDKDKKFISIRHGDSRVIKKYRDKPVLAYGIGFNGAVMVIKHRKGFTGYVYASRFPLHNYTYSSASELNYEEAIKEIKTNKFLIEREIDEDALHDVPKRYQRPVLASFRRGDSENWHKYRMLRLKNGKLRAECIGDYSSKWWETNLVSWLEDFKDKDDKRKLSEVNVPKKILEEIENTILLNKL